MTISKLLGVSWLYPFTPPADFRWSPETQFMSGGQFSNEQLTFDGFSRLELSVWQTICRNITDCFLYWACHFADTEVSVCWGTISWLALTFCMLPTQLAFIAWTASKLPLMASCLKMALISAELGVLIARGMDLNYYSARKHPEMWYQF